MSALRFSKPESTYPLVDLGDGVSAQITALTPALAAKFLAKPGKRQRKLKPANLAKLSRDVAAGRWVFNAQPIIFDVEGNLKNGRHRCAVCIELGVTLLVLCIWGVSDEAYESFDSGAGRTGMDALSSEGITYAKQVSTAATIFYRYSHEMIQGMKKFERPSLSAMTITSIVDEHPGLVEAVKVSHAAGVVLRSHGTAGVCRYVLGCINAADAETFFHGISTGEELKRGDPALALRNRTLGQVPIINDEPLILTFKAWNAYRKGQTIMTLRWNKGEAFPCPV